jgi:hypothetical protein
VDLSILQFDYGQTKPLYPAFHRNNAVANLSLIRLAAFFNINVTRPECNQFPSTQPGFGCQPKEHTICTLSVGKNALHFLDRVAPDPQFPRLGNFNAQFARNVLPRNG